jgi:hypothetical protein
LHGKSLSAQGSKFCTAAVGVIVEYLHLWDLSDFYLQPAVEDRHIWWRQYLAKTPYEGLFLGSTLFGLWERVWKTWARPKCCFFVWLVAHNRCWAEDRCGLPHPECCPLCDQAAETIYHLLVLCVFARGFWFRFISQIRLKPSPRSPQKPLSIICGKK